MELLPISASLGAMGSLAEKLNALQDRKLQQGISKLGTRLLQLSKVRDPPHTARRWMEDVRQLSYAIENCVDTETDWIAKMPPMFKIRVKEANRRYDKYKLDRVPSRTDVFPITNHRLPTVDGGRTNDPVIVGLHDEGGLFNTLCPLLTDGGEQLKVLSIVGVGGIGKTTLAKQLWRKHKPGHHFDCRAFVRTAKKADIRRIFRSILAQVRPHQPPDASEVHELIHDIREHLRNKRYFLIIDDLWATSVWDVARRAFPEGNGSRILTTTEIEDVALACCSYDSAYKFEMQPLSHSHSRELFTGELDEGTNEIIRRCAGLPLAIISISSVLSSQGGTNTVHNREQIQNHLPTNTTPDDVLKQVLIFCYNCLPSCLQTCLLYLSSYPENYIILKEDIMKQWVAEGFILAPTENEKMKIAGNYFDKLVDMGMIQHIDVDYSDEILDYIDEVLYYVRRTVHDLITSKSIQENFVIAIDYSQRTIRFPSKVARLSLQFGSATYATTPETIGLSQVRSLTFTGLETCIPPISAFKLLRFLTLHMWADQPSTGVDLKCTSELALLRSLQVTCNDTVHLPDLMQGLIHLETLEINARVTAIPANIVHLRTWLHLRLGLGTEMPDLTGILNNVTLNPRISLDDSSSPPDSVKTINLLSPISRIPKWVRHLTNLCILKFVIRELQSDGIINLQGLPFLAVLSLRVQQQTSELIGFATGSFTALEYFEFRCGVLCLAFEDGAMPNLQRLKLGFNAHRGEQYGRFLVGIKDMLTIQKISVLIGSAAGVEESDLKAAEYAMKEAIGSHYSKVSIKITDMVEEEFDPPQQHQSIQEQHTSTSSEHPGRQIESQDVGGPPVKQHSIHGGHPFVSSEQPRHRKQESQEVIDPPEHQHSIGGKTPSVSTEQPRVPKQGPPERQHSIGGQQPSASSEQPPRRQKESETQIKQDFGIYSQPIINRMPPPSAPAKNNNHFRPQQPAATLGKEQRLSKTERSIAYLAAGLAKAVVEGSLSKVQAVIEVEAKLPQNARRDLVFIADEFEFMQSLLNVFINEERIENEMVRTWVRKIHQLAYSLEDCMELVIHLDKEKPSFWCLIRKRHCSWITAVTLPLEQAVDEIEYLKARVADMSMRSTRYNLISDSGPAFMQQQQQQQQRVAAVGDTITTSTMLEVGDLTQVITNKDNDEQELQVISVWGTGGDLGKTTIIRKAYNDLEIKMNFACRTWIKLMHPFDPHEFVRRFMAQVYANNCERPGARVGAHVVGKMKASQDVLLEEFVEIVNSETYLIVLENLTHIVDWDSVRTFLPDMKKGSRIVVSTQQFEIASLCIGHSYQQLELKQFSPEHSVCAFFKEGSQDYGNKEGKPMTSEVSSDLSMETISPSNKKEVDEWLNNYTLVGREPQVNELHRHTAVARFSNSPVISVWGIAGIGKSALVRNFYYDTRLHSHQFNKYIWVDISRPFNLMDFSRSLISDHHSRKDPIKECRKLLREHCCLVVIDDIQCIEEWDLIKPALVSTSSSSVIIVITTEASIATYCANNEDLVFNVKGLEAHAAMDLFRKEVHRKNPLSALNGYNGVEVAELILKCGGLPKVIVSIASLLATHTVTLMDTLLSLNQKFIHHLEINPEYDSLQGLFDWMYNYFRTCPDSLKPCIFYLSIFPRGHNIRRRRLVRRWIAEGYSRDSEEESAVEKGENFFSKLLDLSIIQQIPQLVTTAFSDTRIGPYQVNRFISEYIISRRMEENHVFELGPNCVVTNQRTGRHLIILKGWDRDRIVFERNDFSQLRSLTVYGKWESFFISKSMRLLRVLDLEETFGVKDEDLKTMVQWLLCLKFLSLRGCTEFFRLPNSLGGLKQLQTLDVRHTPVVTLPASISKLQKLQYIRAGTKGPTSKPPAASSRLPEFRRRRGRVGVKVPRGIGKLTALHTLSVVNVSASGSGGKCIVEELKKLTQLRKLGVSGINKHNSKEFFFATLGLVHLESLLVQLDKDSHGCMDDISLPGENLRSLTLYGLKDKLPLSSNPLSKLRKLDLEMETLQKNGMEFLGNLPELCILRLQVKQLQPEDGKLHFYAAMYGEELNTFKKMKILEVVCSSSKLHVTFGSRSMKNLELIKIDCSSALYQISGLHYLTELKEVLLEGTDDEAIKTHLESQLVNHPKKLTVKLGNTFVLKD